MIDPKILAAANTEYHATRSEKASPMPKQARRDASAKNDQSKPSVVLVRGSDVKIETVSWLCRGWLARGKLHIIAGHPEAGKTTAAMSFAAIVTRGGTWPNGTVCERPGNVVIWSGEDGQKDTLAPRLVAADADMDRIYFVESVREGGKSRAFDPAKDMEPLSQIIEKIGGASLVILDPVVSAVAGDSHKNSETRRGLQPLVDLATRFGVAVVGISHLSKGTAGNRPIERLSGSLAFGAVARVVMLAAQCEGEDSPPRILVRAKSNIGPSGTRASRCSYPAGAGQPTREWVSSALV